MRVLLITIALLILAPQLAAAPKTLNELLDFVRQERVREQQEHRERENRFVSQLDSQRQLLEEARLELAQAEQRGENLQTLYEENEQKLEQQQEHLDDAVETLGEFHSVFKNISNDTAIVLNDSVISVDNPERLQTIQSYAEIEELPSIEQVESLWQHLLEIIVDSSKVIRFSSKVVTSNGDNEVRQVVRVGSFNVISNGKYLRYLSDTGKLVESNRQPPYRFQRLAQKLEQVHTGLSPIAIDPTRGAVLALFSQTPDLITRIRQGGIVGYIIMTIGVIGLFIALERFIALSIRKRGIKRQLRDKKPNSKNPLGRIMMVYQNDKIADMESLSLKLDEAILREIPGLQRRLGTLSLLAAIAPLLGLLGTVIGIIETFQSITLYGTGDPRLMSGGISLALITTVIGLIVAVPLLLMHSFLSSKSNELIQILDEKSAAIVAAASEKRYDG